MLSRNEIDKIAGVVKSAATSVETEFLEVGGGLGTAVDIIGTLQQTFDLLSCELQGDNLMEATDALSRIVPSVSALSNAGTAERHAVGRLAELTATVQQRVVLMGKAVSGIGMLAINARIEAASIGEAGADFASFANEMGHTLKLAQVSLQQLTRELGEVARQLRAAEATQHALTRHQTTALRLIPLKLQTSIGAIRDRSRRAIEATSAATQQTRHVAQRIGSAVAALQIGDITRQRLEHVEFALAIVGEILLATHRPQSSSHSDWAGTEAQLWGLALLCCRLQSAQLLDAADELDHEVGQILSSIRALVVDANEILRLGNIAAGASDGGRGTFLVEIEEPVAEVSELLDGLGQARREADDIATAVSGATTRLVAHASALRSLEGDIRMMGLNTSLKCGRLGTTGRPLLVIAQELRAYANQIAVNAGAVTLNLDNMKMTAGSLLRNDLDARSGDIAAVASNMAKSTARLETAGQCLVDGLGTLERGTEGVSALLLGTIARATGHEDLGRRLRQAAADLGRLVAKSVGGEKAAIADEDRMLELLSRNYTMDRERTVHGQNWNGRASSIKPVVPPATAAGVEELEDFLF